MKPFYITLLIVINSSVIVGQTSRTDSIVRLLSGARQDTNRVLLLTQLAGAYQFYKSDSAILLVQQAVNLARKLNFVKGEARALNQQGEVLRLRGQLPEALKTLFDALETGKGSNDAMGKAEGMSNIGLVFLELSEYRRAANYFKESKQISPLISTASNAFRLSNLGKAYERMNMLDSAFYFERQAHGLMIHLPPSNVLNPIYLDLGNLHERLGNYDSAFYYYQASLRNTYFIGDILNRSFAGYSIGELFYKLHQLDSSLYYARPAFVNAQSARSKRRMLETSTLLAKLYKDRNNMDSAFYYQQVAMATKDSLFGPDKFKQLQLLAFTEQQRQQELLTKQAQAKSQSQKTALSFALAVFLLLAIILFRNNRNKQKANELLERQKQEIDQQKTFAEKAFENLKVTQAQLIQSEKMASLGELTAGIAHEIQNPLNFVNNFSDVNRELLDELEEEADKGNMDVVKAIAYDIKENEQKINHHGKRADAIVKGMLQHSRSSSGVKEPTDINALCDEYLRLSYHGLRAKDKSFNATMKTDFDASLEKINIIPQDVGRVILNLLTNAFYAVNERKKQQPDGYEPTVSVSTKKIGNKVEIKVSDNGNGIPQKVLDKIFQPFFTTKPTGQGTGLGLSLSYDIIKAHGGEIKVETKDGKGSEFIVFLKQI